MGLADALAAKVDNGSSFSIGSDVDLISATNGTLTIRSGGGCNVRVSQDAGNVASLGDIDINGNGTRIEVDDGNATVQIYASTAFYLNGQLVTFGPADSGGAGNRILVVPN